MIYPARVRDSASAAIAILALSTLSWAGSARADIRLPRLVGDNMVLQREAPITIWGWADPGESVTISFREQRRHTRADTRGNWSMTLAPLAAGGPDTLQLAGHRTITLSNILVGDVWLASGQSNMEFPLQAQGGFGGVNHAARELAKAQYPRMRLFLVDREVGFAPQEDLHSEGWQPVTPATAGRFSAVAYLFGRELYRRNGVPIGLIESSWGGTPAECWISAGSLRRFPEFGALITRLSQVDEQAIAAYRASQGSQGVRRYDVVSPHDPAECRCRGACAATASDAPARSRHDLFQWHQGGRGRGRDQ